MELGEENGRRPIRLADYDYSGDGAYFITICSHSRISRFGKIVNGEMQLNGSGNAVKEVWEELTDRFPNVLLDAFIIMPNHIHGIIFIESPTIHELPPGNHRRNEILSRRRMLLPQVIGFFKMNSSKRINLLNGRCGIPIWQRNYYEHIVRNEKALEKIREYIINNPLRWELDRENLDRRGKDEFDDWLRQKHSRNVYLNSVGRKNHVRRGGNS